jgi:hypothetical protein
VTTTTRQDPPDPATQRRKRPSGTLFGAFLALASIVVLSGVAAAILDYKGITPHLTWQDSHDPGVQACIRMRDAHQAAVQETRQAGQSVGAVGETTGFAIGTGTVTMLLHSSNPHLVRAGTILDQGVLVPNDQGFVPAQLPVIRLAQGDIGAGCTEVGVQLPSDFFP